MKTGGLSVQYHFINDRYAYAVIPVINGCSGQKKTPGS